MSDKKEIPSETIDAAARAATEAVGIARALTHGHEDARDLATHVELHAGDWTEAVCTGGDLSRLEGGSKLSDVERHLFVTVARETARACGAFSDDPRGCLYVEGAGDEGDEDDDELADDAPASDDDAGEDASAGGAPVDSRP